MGTCAGPRWKSRGVLLVAILFLLSCVASMATAQTQDNDSPHDVTLRNTLIARYNPLGLIDHVQATYSYRLYRSESPLLATNFASVSFTPSFSPSFVKLGGLIEVQPLSILKLYGGLDWFQYFGNFDYLQSFPSAADDFSDTRLSELSDLGTHYDGDGLQLILGALLQLKVGPVAARTNFRTLYSDFDLRADDPVYYDILNDMLFKNGGWAFLNDADILYLTDFGLTAGIRHNYTRVDYAVEDFGGGIPQEDQKSITTHRIGPLVAYEFFNREEEVLFDQPTLFLLVNWYIEHPWRTGVDVHQAVPFVALGFSFTGDLI
ncbi:MAG: hypothetical protein JW797_06165 [Bradymonadales bacterium]|nr:hypothetical protein [Bradymonadales bacterium]